jgi:hypothetical protein
MKFGGDACDTNFFEAFRCRRHSRRSKVDNRRGVNVVRVRQLGLEGRQF